MKHKLGYCWSECSAQSLLLWHIQAASTRHVTIAEYWAISNLVWYGTSVTVPCVTLILPVGSHGNKAWCRRLMLDVTLTCLIEEIWYHSLVQISLCIMSLWLIMINALLSPIDSWHASILTISFMSISLALGQLCDCPSASDINIRIRIKKSHEATKSYYTTHK